MSSQIDLDLAKGYKITNQQEAMVSMMFLGERVLRVDRAWFSSGYFHMLVGIHWQTYYRNLMIDLCKLGILERMFHRGTWWYTLTDTARVSRDEYWRYAQRNIRRSLESADTIRMELGLDDEPPF